MLRIGDFSRVSQVSVKTLHHYDEVGLLRPARVDRETGYRYYAAAQLSRVHRILTLKALGFSLEQIAALLDADLPPAQLQHLLREKQAELRRTAEETAARLTQVDTWLIRLERGDGNAEL